MKINNPQRFFTELSSDINYSAKKRLSTLMTRGDVIRKYCSFDSSAESDWHIEENPLNDTWIKFSFDAGFTYPLKFRYKNNLIIKQEVLTATSVVDGLVTFDLSIYSESMYDAMKNGRISLVSQDESGWTSNIYDFKFIFDDQERTLKMQINSELPIDSKSIIAIIGIDATTPMALAVASPVYSSTINAIPTIYDETFGVCNVLDESIPQITCTTKLENVNKVSVKVISSDSNVTGNVKLAFACGSITWEEVIPVTSAEEWVVLNPPHSLSGTLVITRVIADSADTLKSDDLVISLCVTNIKVEIV